jgi:hypothetical protein
MNCFHISKAFGTTGLGKLNSFKFPFPLTLTTKSKLSSCFKVVLDGVTLKSNFLPHPKNLLVYQPWQWFNVDGFAPAETFFVVSVSTIRPNISLTVCGNCTSTDNVNGSF